MENKLHSRTGNELSHPVFFSTPNCELEPLCECISMLNWHLTRTRLHNDTNGKVGNEIGLQRVQSVSQFETVGQWYCETGRRHRRDKCAHQRAQACIERIYVIWQTLWQFYATATRTELKLWQLNSTVAGAAVVRGSWPTRFVNTVRNTDSVNCILVSLWRFSFSLSSSSLRVCSVANFHVRHAATSV